ncbi:hypothetical protein BGX24_008961 [Mortierella sp. AD032]|nr:hypothetical protein BGX24_008961 [Mortierella sp. AD032]
MPPAGVDPAADDTSDVRTIAAYSPDGRSLISEGHSGMLQQYDADTGELGIALLSHIGFQCVAYSPNGLQIAVAGWRDEVELWDTQSCTVEYSIYTEYAVSIMEYSPCSRWIALRMKIDGVKVWDSRSGSTWHICPGRPTVTSLAFSPNGVELAVGYLNGEIRIWETGTWDCKMAIKGGVAWLSCVVYPPRSSHLACCYESGTEGIWLFGEKEGNNLQVILEHDEFKVNGMESDWAYATTVEGFFGDVRKVTWRPNTTEFATASEDGSIRAWKVEEEESGNVSVQLLWGYGGTSFTAPGAVLVGSVGLSTTNRNLLEQRGAIFVASSSANDSA